METGPDTSPFKGFHRIFWSAYTSMERIPTIAEVERIVNRYGYITDFQHFSDLSIGMNIEVRFNHIDNLHKELSKIIKMDDFEKLNYESEGEVLILLNITFTKGSGNLSIKMPEVPG